MSTFRELSEPCRPGGRSSFSRIAAGAAVLMLLNARTADAGWMPPSAPLLAVPAGTWHLAIYSVLIIVASLLGGWLPSIITLTHKRMQVMMSFVGGLMLGISLFHMLPHALHQLGPDRHDFVTLWMMAGLLTMFFLLRMFHFHHHDAIHPPSEHHDHDCDAEAAHSHGPHPHELSWLGVFLGLCVHTFIDGMVLGASVAAEANASPWYSLLGFGTFLAIVAHKPLDAVTITSLMSISRWPASTRMLVNATFALMCPLGAVLFFVGMGHLSASEQLVLGATLAFSAGVFLCISLSDLLPEMEFHSHHQLLLSGALLAGIGLAWLVHWLEPPHSHSVSPPPGSVAAPIEFDFTK